MTSPLKDAGGKELTAKDLYVEGDVSPRSMLAANAPRRGLGYSYLSEWLGSATAALTA
jgi:hypothetical protein